ncbi:hypothetical protein Pelo_1908 [Pelomyxa schiedti]|nr:hypothetical protein Pelo_1908 [Pelomyxa schiedti]
MASADRGEEALVRGTGTGLVAWPYVVYTLRTGGGREDAKLEALALAARLLRSRSPEDDAPATYFHTLYPCLAGEFVGVPPSAAAAPARAAPPPASPATAVLLRAPGGGSSGGKYTGESGIRAARRSEEVRVGALAALEALLDKYGGRVDATADRYMQGVSTSLVASFLDDVRDSGNRELRLLCIKCLEKLLVNVKRNNPAFLRGLLPGVASTMFKVATGDYKAGGYIISNAIRVLAITFHNTLSTSTDAEGAWRSEVATKFRVIVSALFGSSLPHEIQSKWRVRLALVEGASVLLNVAKLVETWETTVNEEQGTYQHLVNCLVFHCYDEIDQVAIASRKYLLALSNQLQQTVQLPDSAASEGLVEEALRSIQATFHSSNLPPTPAHFSVNDMFAKHLSQLIGTLGSPTSKTDQITFELRGITGYLILLGTLTEPVLQTCAQSFIEKLIQLCEFDLFDVVAETPFLNSSRVSTTLRLEDVTDFHTAQPLSLPTDYPRKILKHFHDEKVYNAITELCTTLGSLPSRTLFVDIMCSMLHDEKYTLSFPQICFLLTGILSVKNRKIVSHFSLVENHPILPLDSAISSLILDACIPLTSWESSDTPLKGKQKKSCVLAASLAVECIGTLSRAMGQAFSSHLLTSLYPILQTLGYDLSFFVAQ